MTERELELYKMVRATVPAKYRDVRLSTSHREHYDRITAYLDANCEDLKIEVRNRREAALVAAGWAKVGDGWAKRAAA